MTEVKTLTKEEQLDVIVKIHNFLSNYDRVPGAFASQFAQVLEGLALVANSVQKELKSVSPVNLTEDDRALLDYE